MKIYFIIFMIVLRIKGDELKISDVANALKNSKNEILQKLVSSTDGKLDPNA